MSKFRPASAFLLAVSIFGLLHPVKVWAQVVRVDAIEDSSVNEEAKDSNMNSRSKLLVGVDLQGTAHNRAYSFVRFDSSLNLPPGTEISKANLVIYLEHATGLPTVALRISRITSNWHESILTWNSQPTFADGVTVSVNSTSETKKFDITDFVKYWKTNPTKNFGIQIAGIINNQPYMRTFSDRSGRNLYLEITYYNPADRTPPTISNVKVDPSKTTARILWVTNKLLKEASVEYGLSATFGKKAGAISTQSTSLQVNLTGLKTLAPYFFKIKSVDFAGNQTIKTGTFNTLGSADGPSVSPPKFTAESKNIFNSVVTKTSITNLQATEITYKSALITWDTNIPTNSRVDYGKGQRTLDKQKTSTALLTRHSVRIEGLSPGTRYYYMVKSGAPNAQSASFPPGDPQVFVTVQPTAEQAAADAAAAAQMGREIGKEFAQDLNNLSNPFHFGSTGSQTGTTQTPLLIYHPKVDDITPNSAVARWVTNKPATSEVFYWQPGFFAKSIGNTAHTTNHAITLSNLQPNSRYNYLFRSKTNQGESIISPDAYFISGSVNSSADPLAIQGLSNPIFTHTKIVFIWTTNKPADELLVLTDMVTNDAVSKEDHTFQTQHTQTFDPADLNPDSVYALKLTVKTSIGETKIVTSQFRSLTPLGSGTYPPVGGQAGETLPSDDDLLLEDEFSGQADDFVDPDQVRETTGEEPLIGETLVEDQEPATGSSEPVVDTKPILSIPKGSVLSGIISQIPIIGKLLGADAGADVSAPKPDLTKILLIVLVIVLILVLLFRKRAPKVDAPPLAKNKPETSEKVEPKPKKRGWLIFIILLIIGIILIQSFGFMLNPAMLLAPLVSKFLDQKLPPAKTETGFSYIEGSGPNLSVKKLDQSLWPEGSQGGTFEIGPAGEFNNLAKLAITLDKPVTGFTLGYWYPEDKKWIRIPTVSRSGSTYEGYLTHASLVAGSTVQTSRSSITGSQSEGVAGSGDFKFRDSNLQSQWEQIEAYLTTLQQDYDRGTGTGSDLTWNLIKGILATMSPAVISHCRGQPALADRVEFLQLMAVAQLYGFDDVFQQFTSAWNTCMPLAKEVLTSSYIIKQTDNIPYSLNITGIGKATGESTIVSDGVVIKAGSGFGWQGDWQVVQNTTSSGQLFNQINLKGFTSSGVSSNAKTKDLTMLLFSLEGVAAGSEFPLYIVRIGAYEEDISGPTQDVIFSLNNHVFGTGRIKPDSKTISSKGGLEVKAKLLESYGKDGALISYGGGMSSIAGQQGEAIKQIGEMAQADPTLKRIYDEMMAQSSAEIKLRIIPSGI